MGLIYSFGAQDRQVLVYGPDQWMQLLRDKPWGEKKLPLVVMLPDAPLSGTVPVTPEAFAAHTRMQEVSTGPFAPGNDVLDEDVFFTMVIGGLDLQVANNGVVNDHQGRNGWNSGHMFMEALIAGADDVAFIDAAMTLVKNQLRGAMNGVTGINPQVIDNARRFVVGMGNGGEMVYRLLAETSLFRGAAVVGGAIGGKPVAGLPLTVKHSPQVGLSPTVLGLLHIHGSADPEVTWADPVLTDVDVLVSSAADDARVAAENPASGSASIARTDYLPVTAIQAWVDFLPNMPVFVIPTGLPVTGLMNGGVPVEQWLWQGSSSVVKLWKVNMGHDWPNFDSQNTWEPVVEIWTFFKSL